MSNPGLPAPRLCPGCFTTKLPDDGHCLSCGWTPPPPGWTPHLPPESMVAGQYEAGKLLFHNQVGFAYLGFDAYAGTRVTILEYFPAKQCLRGADGQVQPVGPAFGAGITAFEIEAGECRKGGVPNLIQVSNLVKANGTAYLVMPHEDGMPLTDVKQLPSSVALRMLNKILDSLETLHRSGRVHGKLSPESVYVAGSGRVYLMDLGITRKALADAAGVDDDGFAAPEAVQGKPLAPATDVYGAAATLYRAVAGDNPPPVRDRKIRPVFHGHAPPQFTTEQQRAIEKALSVAPGDRYSSVELFRHALEGAPVKAKRPSEVYGWAALGVGVVLLAGSAYLYLRPSAPAQPVSFVSLALFNRVAGAAADNVVSKLDFQREALNDLNFEIVGGNPASNVKDITSEVAVRCVSPAGQTNGNVDGFSWKQRIKLPKSQAQWLLRGSCPGPFPAGPWRVDVESLGQKLNSTTFNVHDPVSISALSVTGIYSNGRTARGQSLSLRNLEKIRYSLEGVNPLFGERDLDVVFQIRAINPDGVLKWVSRNNADFYEAGLQVSKSLPKWKLDEQFELRGSERFTPGNWIIEIFWRGRKLTEAGFRLE